MKISLTFYCLSVILIVNAQTPLINLDSNAQKVIHPQWKQNGVDVDIFHQVCDSKLHYPSIGLPYFATMPFHQVRSINDFYFNPMIEFQNTGTSTAGNVIAKYEIKFNNSILSSGQKEYPFVNTNQRIISKFSYSALSNINNAGDGLIRYQISTDSNDIDLNNNSLDLNFIISDNHLSRSRFKLEDGEPTFTHEKFYPLYPSSNEIHMPFLLKYAKGAIIDTIYGSIYSETDLPNTYLEARIYKWLDLNGNQMIDLEEIFLLGVNLETIDENYSSNQYRIRMPLIQIIEPANIIDTSALFIASIIVHNVSGLISFGFDCVYNHRLEMLELNKISKIETNDYPYRLLYDSSRILFNQGQIDYNILKSFICNKNGVHVEDYLFAPASIAVHITEPDPTLVKTESMGVIFLFPNPCQDYLNLVLTQSDATNFQYEIMNQEGKKIELISKIKSNVMTFETSDLPTGIYFFKLKSESKAWIKKFIIQR